jgi:hypothetical protein
MDDAARPEGLFAGDLDDPWVAAIAEALPGSTLRRRLVGDLPEHWPPGCAAALTLILHRPTLSIADFERFRRQRRAGLFPRLILCVGPHARYADVQPWAELAEAVVPEATASETIARHVALCRPPAAPRRAPGVRPAVAVISGNAELASWLADACRSAGYGFVRSRRWSESVPTRLALWDVPVLARRWPEELAAEANRRAVVALLGLADRATVALARSHGAAACLDLPCDPADLVFVLDRLAARAGRPYPGDRARLDPAQWYGGVHADRSWPLRVVRPTMEPAP